MIGTDEEDRASARKFEELDRKNRGEEKHDQRNLKARDDGNRRFCDNF